MTMESMKSKGSRRFTSIIKQPQYAVYLILILLMIVGQILSPGYISVRHVSSILRLGSYLGLICIGQTLIMITGNIDMSVTGSITLGNVVGAMILMGKDGNLVKALFACIGVGILVGIGNAFGVNKLKIPTFIMTLAMGKLLHGVLLVITNGSPRGSSSPILTKITAADGVGMFSWTIIIWAVLAAIAIFLLKRSTYGRKLYAVGSNRIAASFSGINIEGITLLSFIIASVMYTIVGFLLVGYTGTTYLEIGNTYDPDNIASVIIGGTTLSGGEGGYVGTIAGVLIMIVIVDMLMAFNIPEAIRQIVKGAIIVVMIILYSKRGGERK